jgi:2,3-bisphosphoglycerate-dependent phosphoglycerate mutase
MKLLLIRHAQSLGNVDQRMQGHNLDPLSGDGILQAQHLGKTLGGGWQPSHLYSSTLPRAVQTAELLLGFLPCPPPIHCAEELQELNNGVFNGLTWQEAETLYPDLCQQLLASSEWVPIPGAETLQAARERAELFLQTLLSNHSNDDQIWIVTHGGFLQYLIATLLGSDRTWGLSIPPTALFEFWLDRERWFLRGADQWNPTLWQVHRFNDAQHLNP